METAHREKIEQLLKGNKIFVFMKGDADHPKCGFSSMVVGILKQNNASFGTFDVLEDPEMRQAIKDYSEWPTLPQVYIDGNFVGGSDILMELSQNGELKAMLG